MEVLKRLTLLYSCRLLRRESSNICSKSTSPHDLFTAAKSLLLLFSNMLINADWDVPLIAPATLGLPGK